MIEIHLGIIVFKNLPGVLRIIDAADYIDARSAIRDALRTRQALHVSVENRLCDEWFWDLELFPEVEFLREEPTLKLREKLQVTALPSELDDPIIISELKLLELPAPTEIVRDVNSWVLGHKLGAVWAVVEPSYTHLTDLLAWWGNNTVVEITQVLINRKMQTWVQRASGQLQAGYQAIMREPSSYAKFLCCWKALAEYDEHTREDWLRQLGWYFPEVQWLVDKLLDLPLPREANKLLSPMAEAYWRRRLVELERDVTV